MLIYILLGISALFLTILLIKSLLKIKKICVICSSIFLTWIFLLILFYLDKFTNKIIISLLLGMSITGIYYLVEKNVNKKLTIFRLPFILTLIAFGYFIITLNLLFNSIIFLVFLWLIFLFLYFFKENPKLKSFSNKLVECCRNW